MNVSAQSSQRGDASRTALTRILAISCAISLSAVFSLVYFFGSERMARDVLVHPETFAKIAIRDLDPTSGRNEEFYVDRIELQELVGGSLVAKTPIDERAYSDIFRMLESDPPLPTARFASELTPRFRLQFLMKPDAKLPHESIVLQEIDFFADDQTYRVGGRKDLRQGDQSWFFRHRGIAGNLQSIAQLSRAMRGQIEPLGKGVEPESRPAEQI